MRIGMVRLFIFLLFISQYSLAGDEVCDKYSAYDNFDKALENKTIKYIHKNDANLGPMRDQDSVGYCYSYAAADILEHWLKKTGQIPLQENVSGLALGLNDHKVDWQSKNADFHAMAILKQSLKPELERINSEMKEMSKRYDVLSQKSMDLEDQFTQKHPDIEQLQSLKNEMSKMGEKKSDQKKYEDLNLQKYNLEEKIFKEVHNNPEFKTQSKLIQDEKDKILKERKHNSDLLFKLAESFSPKKSNIPDGGFAADAINSNWPHICFEKEVNSRDLGLADLYFQNRDFFNNPIYTPDTLQGALGYIALTKFDPTQEDCPNYEIVKSIFPGFSFANAKEFMNFIEKLNASDNVFEELIKKSCSHKVFSIKPKMINKSVAQKLPLEDNIEVMNHIDQGLAKGGIVSISYRSQILDGEELAENIQDYHASVVTGALEVCGEPYYVLRNSWGEKSCESHVTKFKIASTKDELIKKIDDERYRCVTNSSAAVDKKYPNCKNNKCHELREQMYSDGVNLCEKEFEKKKVRAISHPYFCDPSGNFIVSKEYFKKGIYSATIIDN